MSTYGQQQNKLCYGNLTDLFKVLESFFLCFQTAEQMVFDAHAFHHNRIMFHNRQIHYLGFKNPYGNFNMSEVKDFIAKMINR